MKNGRNGLGSNCDTTVSNRIEVPPQGLRRLVVLLWAVVCLAALLNW